MRNIDVTILCSGVALGVYIPAILADRQLRRRGFSVDTHVIETYMLSDKKNRISDNKKAFHENFRLALKGQKMLHDLWPMMDENQIDSLFGMWADGNRRNFIIFSGFWMSVIKRYMEYSGFRNLNVDIVHMDAVVSASWKGFREESERFNNFWLFDWEHKRLGHALRVTEERNTPYAERLPRYVIHGGGWGMGTYKSKIPELEESGKSLDVVGYFPGEAESCGSRRTFMVDPGWAPWERTGEYGHIFPPFGEVTPGVSPRFVSSRDHHELFDVIRQDRAIISKPGGATLLDSLSSATPIVMLEPFGEYEEKNAALWEHLGFGIYFDEWKNSGFDDSLIANLHRNLLNVIDGLPSYTDGSICGISEVNGDRCDSCPVSIGGGK